MRLKQYMTEQRVDILYLQETHFTPDILQELQLQFTELDMQTAYDSNLSKGCTVLINTNLEYDIINCISDPNGRYILLNITLDLITYTLSNIYANNNLKEQKNLFHTINILINNNIIGGDVNDTLTNNDRQSRQDIKKSVRQ